jgi:hypothetical protein
MNTRPQQLAMNFDQASTGRASEPARVTITTMDINPAIVGPVLNAHYPHMSADGNGWHFASLQGDIIITWIGKLPAAYGLRFDLIASIRARLEAATIWNITASCASPSGENKSPIPSENGLQIGPSTPLTTLDFSGMM